MPPQKKPYLPTTTTPMIRSPGQAAQKKIPRRSSKPIINWFQRKLAGSGKGKRTENVPLTIADIGVGRSGSNRQMGRVTSSPLPSQPAQSIKPLARRKTRSISLNGDEDCRDFNIQSYADDDLSLEHSSLNRESIWSPASALEADDDASVRPIPPSAPPSPSPSRSSSSYLSDPRTFRSMAASTKPTTLLSIDLNGNGMAHIAQAPNPPLALFHRFAPHVRQSSSLSSPGLLGSGGSITFSALPSTQPSSRPSSLRHLNSLSPVQAPHNNGAMSSVQAPLHTTHHPRNNPRPSSPPLDNASVLTLASSAFGIPNRPGAQNYSPSAIGDSASHYGGSITFPDAESHYVLGEDERMEERDFDASVRALRPRSSRRGSWESEVSRWSARVQGTGTPSLVRERSLWTSNSIRTGGFSTEHGEIYETADDQTPGEITDDSELFQDVNTNSELISIIIDQPESQAIDPHSQKKLADSAAGPDYDVKITWDSSETTEVLRRVSTDTVAQPAAASTLPSPLLGKDLEVGVLDNKSMPVTAEHT
ncbi:hypothetical protein BYT27DRAFT_7108838 [Phlegmacium glaucopus]|nr:hypothetical protein BYT27DRAFT_7108838 [Phlegmacium glaucopus]